MTFAAYRIETQWNPTPIETGLERATAQNMRTIGANVRTRIRDKLKYGTGSSRPGQPPIVHRRAGSSSRRRNQKPAKPQSSSPLREGVLYGAEPMDVIIGCTKVSGAGGSVARALEEGGMTTRSDGKRIHVEARPFLKVAFYEELPQATPLWADSI